MKKILLTILIFILSCYTGFAITGPKVAKDATDAFTRALAVHFPETASTMGLKAFDTEINEISQSSLPL